MFDEDICEMELCFVDGNEDELALVVTFWNGDEEDWNTYNMKYDKKDKEFDSSYMFMPEDVWEVIKAKESMYLKDAEILKIGQKSVDGVIMKDEDHPFIEKEKIDVLFEQCKHVYCDADRTHIYFTFANEYKIKDLVWISQLENPLLFIQISNWWTSVFEKKVYNFEKLTVGISEGGRKIVGGIHGYMPQQKHKAYFDSRIEELFPLMIEAYEQYQKRSRLKSLFK
ncbi:hypothetical protein [Bacillus wiedmannii]|uniref:hypothetical protein n=1 Tax=Bacillus wiedmannii TaxID=1890302 RepID=UPI001E4555D0|nr:hypothetical protein [Bacillus wiedmannii]MCC2425443.1 hypothetical protein [Bacillus wiedmannii]